MALTGQQQKELHGALMDAFPSRDALAEMVRFELSENLAAIAAGDGLRAAILGLITWAEANGRTGDLVRGARAANDGNPRLRDVAARLLPILGGAAAATGGAGPGAGATPTAAMGGGAAPPRAAAHPSVPGRMEVYDALCAMNDAQFEEVIFRLGITTAHLSPSSVPQARRAKELIERLEQPGAGGLAAIAQAVRAVAPHLLP